MSTITVYQDNAPQRPLLNSSEYDVIRNTLNAVGVRFERWRANREITKDMPQEQIIDAYRNEIERLQAEEGYVTVDTISLFSDNPQKDALRQKFLNEHTHSEDEVRFFVRGEGMFYLHIADKVYMVRCCQDDLISVPANTTHWFDMGPQPNFTAVRLFNNPAGWVADFTGSDIAERFPRFE